MSQATTMPIKDAVSLAREKLLEFYEDASSVQLEEVGLTDDESLWLITLSFLTKPVRNQICSIELDPGYRSQVEDELGIVLARQYKLFEIDRRSGKFHAMRIRDVTSA